MPERRIRLVVTGDLERKALVPSLRRHFPKTDIHNDPVNWLPPRKTHGATSHRLREGAPPSKPMRNLARAVLAEALHGSDGRPADLVVAIDDLELHNVDQPEVVCQHFAAAMRLELDKHSEAYLVGDREEHRARVRARCSFHLVSPMVESYLFGEQAALVRAGCEASVAPRLRSTDWEDFWCTDPDFQSHCSAVNTRMSAPPLEHGWWHEERHAKHYLEHLVSQTDRFYEETSGGAEALTTLAWTGVPKQPAECPLIRALFEDLADFFGVHSPLGPGQASPITYAGGAPKPGSPRLMRNLA